MGEDSTVPKKNKLHALAFLEVGLFEFFFVTVVLFLLFGTLNYFNILPVSDVFPKYLSWLPKQTKTASQGETLQPQNFSAVPKISPTPTGYMDKIAQDILVSFLPQVFNPSFVPQSSKISLKQYKGTANSFNATWDTKQPTANVIFTISQDKKSLESINLYLTREDSSTPSVAIAGTLTSEVFSIISKGVWACKPFSSGSYCENFWQESDNTKVGVGIMELNENKKLKVIFMCQYSKDSNNYSWRSCSSEFVETGVK